MNALVAGLLASSMLVAAPGVRTGDYVFPKTLPGKLSVGNQVVGEVSILEYLTVLQVKGGWLWVESHDLLSNEAGHKGWISVQNVDDIHTQIQSIGELAAKNLQEAPIWAVLGLLQNLNGDHKQAIASLTRSIAAEPANEFYYYIRGQLWIGINQYQKALDDFKQAASLMLGDRSYQEAVELAQQLVKNSEVPSAPPDPAKEPTPTKDTTIRFRNLHKNLGTPAMIARTKDKLNKQGN